MSNLNSCIKTKSGNIILPRGRLSYPALFKATLPKGEKNEDKARYQTSIVFPKGVDLTLIATEVESACIAEFGKDYKTKYKVKKPFLKSEEQPKMSDIKDDFPIFVRTNSPNRPQVVRANMTPVDAGDESDEVYPGRWARVSVRVYAYDHPTGGKGVSLGLQNVQLLEHDERFGGARPQAQDEFETIADIDTGAAGGGSTDALFE